MSCRAPIRERKGFFDRHPLLAVLLGLLVAILIAYQAAPDSDAPTVQTHSAKESA